MLRVGGFIRRDRFTADEVPAPSGAGWEVTPSNVGLAGVGLVGSQLPLYTGAQSPVAGTTLYRQRIEATLDLSAGNITVDQCLIKPASVGAGLPVVTTSDESLQPPTQPVIIRDCDIDCSALADEPAGRTTGFWGIANLYRNHIWGMGSGIAILQSGQLLDCEVIGNYVHSLRSVGDPAGTGNHCDGFTIRDFDGISRTCLVQGNRFDCDTANASGALFLQAYGGMIRNVTVEGNLLEGGGYTLVLEAHSFGYANMAAVNNRFAPTGYGPGYVSGGSGWSVFTDNYRYDPNNPPDYRGAFVGGL